MGLNRSLIKGSPLAYPGLMCQVDQSLNQGGVVDYIHVEDEHQATYTF